MKLISTSRYFAALFALVSLLFMQLAVAWYECPVESVAVDTQSLVTIGDGAPRMARGCEGMDTEQPSLCFAHSQVGNQSLDKPHAAGVQPLIAALVAFVPRVEVSASTPRPTAWENRLLGRDVAPAIAIRHCCFRI